MMSSCYKCQAPAKQLFFCEKCGAVLPPLEQNPFKIFSLSEDFVVDLDGVRKAYDELLKKLHPDQFLADKISNLLATQHVMQINNAYKRLLSPRLRSEFLLARQGVIVNQDSKDTVKPDQMLLMEVFELKERVGDLENAEDKIRLKAEVTEKLREIEEVIKECFRKQDFQKVAMETMRYRYYEKTLEDLSL